jgi:hypothetical protein
VSVSSRQPTWALTVVRGIFDQGKIKQNDAEYGCRKSNELEFEIK